MKKLVLLLIMAFVFLSLDSYAVNMGWKTAKHYVNIFKNAEFYGPNEGIADGVISSSSTNGVVTGVRAHCKGEGPCSCIDEDEWLYLWVDLDNPPVILEQPEQLDPDEVQYNVIQTPIEP